MRTEERIRYRTVRKGNKKKTRLKKQIDREIRESFPMIMVGNLVGSTYQQAFIIISDIVGPFVGGGIPEKWFL